MKTLKIATFNCENLFTRFKFTGKVISGKNEMDKIIKNGFILNDKYFDKIIEKERSLTADAIKETNAEIIALEEIENMETLKSFNSEFLSGCGYKYKMLIDANDPRFIDVAVLSKIPIESVVTHQFMRTKDNKSYIFSRDCLEINFKPDVAPVTLFVNHFKSMMEGRDETRARRLVQSETVLDIIKNRFGNKPEEANWIVLGDLNDYPEGNTGVEPLLNSGLMTNVIERLPKEEQWTHWWDARDEYKQIDYIFLSKSLAEKNSRSEPVIIRKGLSKKANKYTGERFDGIGDLRPHASDHCPVVIEMEL